MHERRKFPLGAELIPGRGVDFRVWAPRSPHVAVAFEASDGRSAREVPLSAEGGGYFSALIPDAQAGDRYRLKLDRGAFPDPASRFQPEGPHGPSQVVDPNFPWTDGAWRGRPVSELVIYELHLGTFTREGTWRAALERLPDLAQLGVTMVEVMPIADFPGTFGWGYDGVDLFAPCRLYGSPHDARAFINRAHELGIAVILDVVYNHIGPDGNFLREFSASYFSSKYANEWGDPLNFDGDDSAPVREFFVSNARYWIGEFHFDGLRLDATQQIFDASTPHILAEIVAAVRKEAGARQVFVVGENECQHPELVRPPSAGGYGLDALWNDDFHHAAHVAGTGRAEAYFSGYRGVAQEFVSTAKFGFLYQGQWYRWQRQRRGRPSFDLRPHQFVSCLQNHDQVANSLHGLRLHQLASAPMVRALTALLLLGPQLPMLFQGQEFAASAPFLYFADHHAELSVMVARGRKSFLRQFVTIAQPESEAVLAAPEAKETFARSVLDWSERERHRAIWQLHADLLRLRREERAITAPERFEGAVLGERAFVFRYFSGTHGDRLLVVNLGADLAFEPAPEPLLAPVWNGGWRVRWSSEAPAYGGGGTAPLETKANWLIPAMAAVLLEPHDASELADAKLSEKN